MNYNTPQIWYWRGASGAIFPHLIYPLTHDLPVAAVNYIMVCREPDGSRYALYIGHTKDGSMRFSQHEKITGARMLGGNEVHLLFGGTKQQRLDIETDLRHAYRTPLNDQPTPADPLGALFGISSMLPPRRVLGLDAPINASHEGVSGSLFGSLAPDLGVAGSPINALTRRNQVLAALLRLD